MERREQPIASCQANGVDAWEYPFFVRPAEGQEPAFLYLEVHLWEASSDLEEAFRGLVRIDGPADLERLGLSPGDDGVYRL
jgi:hypothetical protein